MTYPIRGIRFRLASVYVLWFGGLLAAGALLVCWQMERRSLAEVDRTLGETLVAARELYTTDRPEFGSLDLTVAHIVDELIFADRTLMAFDAGGHVLGHSRPSTRSPVLDSIGSRRVPYPVTIGTPTGRARVQTGDLAWGIHLLVGISLEPLEQQQRTIRIVMLGGLPLLLLSGAGVGVLAARAALRPIGRIAEAVRSAGRTVDAGGQEFPPMPGRTVPDEVGALVSAWNRLVSRLGTALGSERAAAERERAFLADAAHELRTPVAIMMSTAESALAETNPDAREAESLRSIAAEARRMGGLVSDLLLLSSGESIESGRTRVPFFLDDAVTDVVMRAGRMPQAGGRTIRIGQFESVEVEADQDLIERAILALIDNALQHAPQSAVEVSVGSTPGRAWVRVRDWGPGVPPEQAERIFQRFARGQTPASGSGLGLAIARWIAERHQGSLTLETPGAGGATFVLELPIAPLSRSGRPG